MIGVAESLSSHFQSESYLYSPSYCCRYDMGGYKTCVFLVILYLYVMCGLKKPEMLSISTMTIYLP